MEPPRKSEHDDLPSHDLAWWPRSESARERMGAPDDYGSLAMEAIVQGRSGLAVCIGLGTWLLMVVLLALSYIGPATQGGARPSRLADPIAVERVGPRPSAVSMPREAGVVGQADDERHGGGAR